MCTQSQLHIRHSHTHTQNVYKTEEFELYYLFIVVRIFKSSTVERYSNRNRDSFATVFVWVNSILSTSGNLNDESILLEKLCMRLLKHTILDGLVIRLSDSKVALVHAVLLN